MKGLSVVLAALAVVASFVSCASTKVPYFAESGCVNTTVRDTLFIRFPPELEDETCYVEVHSTLVDFYGSDRIIDGLVWFDVFKFPVGNYDIWIRVADYYFKQSFRKD